MTTMWVALLVQEHPQTLIDAMEGRNGINDLLALKLAQASGLELEFFISLQTSYDAEKAVAKK